jgi:long-chain-fatty-acid--CoA ligase ACSBG
MQSFLGLDKCKIMMYGAAPLKQSTIDFFSGFDIPLFCMYGLSETTGATVITLQHQYALGIGGMAINGSHIKIANPDTEGHGEVLIKGRSVMIGYLKNPEATKKVIGPDGYFASGDQGKMHGNWLQITGRIKELIITSGGENIAPVAIEDKFKLHCSACSNIMLLGEQ